MHLPNRQRSSLSSVLLAAAAFCCRFDLSTAQGPFLLDLGDILYAPNTLEDTAKVGLDTHLPCKHVGEL